MNSKMLVYVISRSSLSATVRENAKECKLIDSPVWHYHLNIKRIWMKSIKSSLLLLPLAKVGINLILFNFVCYCKLGQRKRGSLVCPPHFPLPSPSSRFPRPLLTISPRTILMLIIVLDLARILATTSPSFGATCTPDALLTACDWSLPYTSSKVRDTNTLLALRTFANLFTTPTGRKNMIGMKVPEWLEALRRGRSWEEVGARKLPFVTIVLKYVFPPFSHLIDSLPFLVRSR
jgi:hypothetical protein